MSTPISENLSFCCLAGADISAACIDVAMREGEEDHSRRHRFGNTSGGHQDLIEWLAQAGEPVRIVVEASGIYGADLCHALSQADGIEVMVVNPRAAKTTGARRCSARKLTR